MEGARICTWGVDLGTSGLKALLVDDGGAAVASASRTYGVANPAPGWSEQDPADWTAACDAALGDLAARAGAQMAEVKGIGVSGHMHGATLLDAAGDILRPCMLWNDTRADGQATRLDADARFRDISGNIVFAGFTAPKLMWLAEHEPEVFARVATVLLPKDYLTYWLCGALSGDMSDSAGTSWLDVGARDWSEELLSASGMRRAQMPVLAEGCDIVGTLRPALRARWGMRGEVSVVAGAGDNAAAACGVGALGEGDGFVSLGTSGVILAARDTYAPRPASAVHTFCHAVPERWYQMGVILAATDSLNWLAGILGRDAADLTGALGDRIDAPGGLAFLPYLSGERTPHNDASVRGAFVGLSIDTSAGDMIRAVLEGVSFALRDCLEALAATGADLKEVLAIGGGSKSPYWVELLATVLDLRLDLPAQGDFGAALGAARLAMIGVTGAAPEAVITRPPVLRTVEPRAELRGACEDAYQAWRGLYPAVSRAGAPS